MMSFRVTLQLLISIVTLCAVPLQATAHVELHETQPETFVSQLKMITPASTSNLGQDQNWRQKYLAPRKRSQTTQSPFSWTELVGLLVLVNLLLGFTLRAAFRVKERPRKSALKFPEHSGLLFSAQPEFNGNTAAPLVPAGKLAAAKLQMFSGRYAPLKQAYLATGRIGYAQIGVPTAEDFAFGTGFLVSDRHVVTNRHVHGLYGHYLLDESDPGGIEFIAEKGNADSDFVPFNGEPPLLLPDLDIAIYTLSRPVTNRAPLQLNPTPPENLDHRNIIVIGYPDTHSPQKPEIVDAVEKDPVFAVKRISQGQIFRHSTDTDSKFGVKVPVHETKHSTFMMPAICHTALTLGGNSGSPVVDINDGSLLGVHFAGYKVFNQKEAANLAMAVAQLTQCDELMTYACAHHHDSD